MGKVTVARTGSKKRLIKKSKVTYKLPTKLSVPIEDLGGYVLLIYGRKKIGKTSLASMFSSEGRKVLFLFFEPGGKGLRLYQEDVSNNWKKFKSLIKLLEKDEEFSTVVIDTADYAYDDCLKHVCYELNISHPAEEGYGKGWNAVKTEFVETIRLLLKSGKGVIFISHQKEVEEETRDGETYNKTTNTLSRQAKEAIEGLVDIWANYDYEGDKRVLTILGDNEIDAGHRLKERFKYTDGTRIRKIPMGSSEEQGYKNFIDAFNNESVKGGKGEKKLKKKLKLPVRKKVRRRK